MCSQSSHLIVVPAGVSPTSALQSSPLFPNQQGVSSMGGATGGGDDFDMYGGIDPTLDPELAMAIRISQEEARAQEEARVKVISKLKIFFKNFVIPYFLEHCRPIRSIQQFSRCCRSGGWCYGRRGR